MWSAMPKMLLLCLLRRASSLLGGSGRSSLGPPSSMLSRTFSAPRLRADAPGLPASPWPSSSIAGPSTPPNGAGTALQLQVCCHPASDAGSFLHAPLEWHVSAQLSLLRRDDITCIRGLHAGVSAACPPIPGDCPSGYASTVRGASRCPAVTPCTGLQLLTRAAMCRWAAAACL